MHYPEYQVGQFGKQIWTQHRVKAPEDSADSAGKPVLPLWMGVENIFPIFGMVKIVDNS